MEARGKESSTAHTQVLFRGFYLHLEGQSGIGGCYLISFVWHGLTLAECLRILDAQTMLSLSLVA